MTAREVVAGAVVRVRSGDHEVSGGGFLVGPDLVATCAHVVADAVGGDPYAEHAPDGLVRVDFPLVDGASDPPPAVAAVIERWAPIRPDGAGDVALLRLTAPAPAGARMPPLRRVDRLWGHGFRVFGFPEGVWDGVWATGHIRGEQGTGWFQLQGTPGDQRIEGGFSGAPVWDDDSGAVVGMTVAADRGATTTAYLVPIDQVLGLDPELLPCPYRGLAPFGEEHAEMFFGRDPDIARLVDAVERLPVVAVAGPSGAGKSSLVRAGLLPRLRESGAHVVDVRPVPGVPVLTVLADVPAARDTGPNRVLLVDQFEDLAAVDPAAARELLDRIVHLTRAEPPLRAVVTLRWAALDELLTPELAGVLEAGTVLVAPLDRGRLREAIVGPAERAPGLAFEAGLVERILDDAGTEPGRLPLVGSLLADLWERREGGYLTLRGYTVAGGVAGAVAQHAERVVTSIGPDGDDRLRRLFTLLACPDRDGRLVRRPVSSGELPAPVRDLVPRLVEGRLLVVGPSGTGADTVELAHQALIEHWPRLRGWLTEDRDFLAWRTQLDAQRERWEAAARDDGALLRGTTLAAADEWLPAREDEVAAADRDYVRRSAVRQRREMRRWRLVTAVLAVLVLAAGALSVVAVGRGDELAAQLASANADTLGRESIGRAPSDAAVAAQLALAAWRGDPQSPQARTALAKSSLAMQSVDAVLPDLTGAPIPDFLAGGDTVVVGRPPGFLAVTGVSWPSPQRWELPDTSLDRAAELSPDGRWFTDVGPDGAVRVWDLVGRGAPRVLPGTGGTGPDDVRILRFSPDATRVSWVVPDAGGFGLQIRDGQSGSVVPHGLGVLPGEIASVWLTADPGLVLVRYGDEVTSTRLVVRSLVDGAEVAALPAGSAVVRDGAAVASCEEGDPADLSSASTVVVTPVGGSAAPLRIRGLDVSCGRMELSTDGGALLERVVGALDRDHDLLRLTDLADGRTFHVAAPRSAAVTRSGRDFEVSPTVGVLPGAENRPTVITAHGTSVLRLHPDPVPTGPGRPPTRYLGAGGRYLVAVTDGGATVEDRATGRQLASLPGLAGPDSTWLIADALWVLGRPAGGWELARYELPTLRRAASYELPTAAAGGAPHAAAVAGVGGGPLLTISDGLLTARDPATGQPLGEQVRLGETAEERDWHRRNAVLWSRPAHPGQAAVLTRNGGLQLWDVAAGRLLGTIPASVPNLGAVAFDPAGDRLAALTFAKAVEVWDVDTSTPVRPPIPAPDAYSLVGFDADGYLDVLEGTFGQERLTFLDLERGRESGSMLPGATIAGTITGEPVVEVQGSGGVLPFEIPVTAQVWFDRLCAAADRPFSPAELAILPPGSDTDPPCS